MALARQIIDIPLGAGGLKEKQHRYLQTEGSLVVENGRWSKTGTIVKRNGYSKTAWTPDEVPHTLLYHGSTPVVVTTQGDIYRYGGATYGWTQPTSTLDSSERHPLLPARLSRLGIARTDAAILFCDMAFDPTSGIACYVWIEAAATPEILTALVEESTGRVLRGPEPLGTAASIDWERVWVERIGSNFVLLALDGNPGSIKGFYRTAASGTSWTASTPATVVATATGVADFCADAENSRGHFALSLLTDTIVHRITSTGASDLTVTLTGTDSSSAVCVCKHPQNTQLWVGHAGSSSSAGRPRYTVLATNDYSSVLAATDIANLVGNQVFAMSIAQDGLSVGFADVVCQVAWQEEPDANTRRTVRFARITDGGTASLFAQIDNTVLVGHGVRDEVDDTGIGRVYFAIAHEPDEGFSAAGGSVLPTLQPQGWIVTRSDGNETRFGLVARFLVDRHRWALSSGSGIRQNVTNSYEHVDRIQFLARSVGAATTVSGVERIRLNLGSGPLPKGHHDRTALIGSAAGLYGWDGVGMDEQTPYLYPEDIAATLAAGGLTGDYRWAVVWEWEDSQGVLHRSAPGIYPEPPAAAESLASEQATITLLAPPITTRGDSAPSQIRAALYRTEASGAVFRLVRRQSVTVSGGIVTLTADNVADADLGEVLYTTGARLESEPAPPVHDFCVGKGRVWILDAERRNEVAFSHLLNEADLAPAFHSTQRIVFPKELVAIEVLDDKFIAFAEDEVWAVFGEGPGNTGQGTFSEPQRVVTDQGCVDTNSVVRIPPGLMFRSRRGFELLSQGLQLAPFIGADVEDTASALPTVWSAVTVPEQGQVRFSFGTDGELGVGGEDSALVYDYLFGQWSTWTQHDNMQDAAIDADGVYTWLDEGTDGLMEETPGVYVDNQIGDGVASSEGASGHIPIRVSTPWLKFAGIKGYKRTRRVQVLGKQPDDVTVDEVTYPTLTQDGLVLDVYVDYDDSDPVQTETWAGEDSEEPWEREVHLARQKVESVRFEWSDRAIGRRNSGFEASFAYYAHRGVELASLALELAGKKGLFKLPQSKRT